MEKAAAFSSIPSSPENSGDPVGAKGAVTFHNVFYSVFGILRFCRFISFLPPPKITAGLGSTEADVARLGATVSLSLSVSLCLCIALTLYSFSALRCTVLPCLSSWTE